MDGDNQLRPRDNMPRPRDNMAALDKKMANLELTDATYWDFFEDHLNEIVKYIAPEVFLTKLRSSRVLSESDCEEISSPFIHPTRRERARKFCDVLMTKGFDAFKLFLELLEYEYPHVYQNITNNMARNPPQGYQRHTQGRISQDLEDFTRMGFRVGNFRNQQTNLFNQLEDLQKMLEFTQQEKNDLEREILSLQPYATHNQQLQEKVIEAEREIRNLKDENREFMKKNIQYRDEMDREQSRIEQLLIDRDDLEKQLREALGELDRVNQSQDVLREKFEEERKKSQRLINLTTKIRDKAPPNPNRPNMANVTTRLEILKCDLDAEREKVNDLCATLDVTNADLLNERQQSDAMRRDKLKLQRENDNTHLFLKHAERKNDQYFKQIQELEKEKRKAEEEKILAQQKCWDISDQKQQLFVAKHNLEQKHDRLRQNYERLRQSHRNSLTDHTVQKEAVDGGVGGPPYRQRVVPLSPRSPGVPPHGEDPYARVNHNDLDQSSADNVAPLPKPLKCEDRSNLAPDDANEKSSLSQSGSSQETDVKPSPTDGDKFPKSRPKANNNQGRIPHQRRHQFDEDDPRCWSEDDDIDNDYDNAIYDNGTASSCQ